MLPLLLHDRWAIVQPPSLERWLAWLAIAGLILAGSLLLGLGRYYRRKLRALQVAHQDLQRQLETDSRAYATDTRGRAEQARHWRLQYHKLPFPAYTWQQIESGWVLADCNEAAIAYHPGILSHLGHASAANFLDPERLQPELDQCLASQQSHQSCLTTTNEAGEPCTWRADYCWLSSDRVLMTLSAGVTAATSAAIAQRRERQQAAISQLSQLSARALSFDDFCHQVVALATDALAAEFGSLLELLSNDSAFVLRASQGWPAHLRDSAIVSADAGTVAGYVKARQRPVQFADLRLETRFRGSALLHNYNIVSGISVPIVTDLGFYGVLGVYADEIDCFSEEDALFLEVVSHAIAGACERERRESQFRLFERAFAASSNGIFIIDALSNEGTLLHVNPGFEQLTGYTAAEAIGQSIHLLTGEATDPEAIRELEAAIAGGCDYQASLCCHRKDGSSFWNDLYLAPVTDRHGHLTHFVGIQTDMTERKQFEATLRSERDLLDSIMRTSVTAIVTLDIHGRITFANERAETLLGLVPANIQDRCYNAPDWRITDFAGEVFPDEQLPFVQVIATSQPVFDVRHAIEWPDGSRRYLSINGAPLRGAGEAIAGVVCSVADITESYLSEQALRQSEEQFRRLFALAPIGMMLARLDGTIEQVNPALCETLGYEADELCGTNALDLTHADDRATDFATAQQMLWGEIDQYKFEKRLLAQNGQVVHALLQVVLLADDNGQPSHTLSQIVDITEHKRTEAALWMSEQRLEGILTSIEDVVWSSSAGAMLPLYLNPAAELVYGRPLEDFFLNPNLWLEAIHPEERATVERQLATFERLGTIDVEYRILRPDGGERWLHTRCRLVCDESGRPARVDGISTDITERKQAEAQLRHSAFYDALTDLPNRALFVDRLWHAIRRARQRGSSLFAVLFLDIDSFKVVNDSLGHATGDRLLVAIARRLEGCLRPGDTLARLGGDEFTILLEELNDSSDATQIAQTIARELQLPFKLASQEVYSNVSIGIAFSQLETATESRFTTNWTQGPSLDYDRPEDLLRDADTAMYRAKASGKGRYAIFDQQMHEQAIVRLHLETDLRHALDREQFSVHYQPIVSLVTHKLAGFEALIRWQHPERGPISPARFIPVAEETGLIIPIGQWVLQTAIAQLRTWQLAYPEHHNLTISVNLSGKQLREPDLLAAPIKRKIIAPVNCALAAADLEPASLRLEVTESMLMENTEAATKLLLALRARQIQIGIDDFGTGYSSLSYLHRLPANTLKIDRSFVARMNPDGSNAEIVRAIVTLARTLGMDVVAEGIETAAQLHQLHQLGCEYGQGFFLARPLPAAEAEALIAAGLPELEMPSPLEPLPTYRYRPPPGRPPTEQNLSGDR